MDNKELVRACEEEEYYLKFKAPRDPRVLNAIAFVDRKHFVPVSNCYDDNPLWIGYGQTCSQPSLVAFMSDMLELEEGMNVLEIGSGCGYHAAITLGLIGSKGFLTSLELIPELAVKARTNLERYFNNFDIQCCDGSEGFLTDSFDRIYLTAGVNNKFSPIILASQLKPEGILLFPETYGSIFKQVYKNGKLLVEESYLGVMFVPLRGRNA